MSLRFLFNWNGIWAVLCQVTIEVCFFDDLRTRRVSIGGGGGPFDG